MLRRFCNTFITNDAVVCEFKLFHINLYHFIARPRVNIEINLVTCRYDNFYTLNLPIVFSDYWFRGLRNIRYADINIIFLNLSDCKQIFSKIDAPNSSTSIILIFDYKHTHSIWTSVQQSYHKRNIKHLSVEMQ